MLTDICYFPLKRYDMNQERAEAMRSGVVDGGVKSGAKDSVDSRISSCT